MLYMVGMVFLLGLMGASGWYQRNKRVVWIVVGIGSAGTATGVAVVANKDTPYKMQIPSPPTTVVRLDLQTSRDCDTVAPSLLPAGGIGNNKPLIADQTWTRTGGQSCYPISATAAECFDATEVPYASIDASGVAWALEEDISNRLLQNGSGLNCSNWTCGGTASATALQPSPHAGDDTATIMTVGTWGANGVYRSASGYTADAALHLRMWLKCSSGTMWLVNLQGATKGALRVDCTAIAGAWTLIDASHSAVTVDYPFVANGAGAAGLSLNAYSGTVAASVWLPTLTETYGTGLSVVRTAAGVVSTGAATWAVDNSSGRYYRAGDQVLQTIVTYDASPCWVVSGTDLLLTGNIGNECNALLYALEVKR